MSVKLNKKRKDVRDMPRRGENIRKRKDGRWEARYIAGKDENGKSIYASVYATKYQIVKQKRDEAVKLLELENISNCDIISFEQLCNSWLQSITHSIKESTYAVYINSISNHLIPYFKNKNLKELSNSDLEEFINLKAEAGLASSTQKMIFILLKRIFQYGTKLGYCSLTEISFPAVRRDSKGARIMSPYEREIFERYLDSLNNFLGIGIKLCMYTGLRIGEMSGLRWEDIDFENETIHVARTVIRIKNVMYENNGTAAKTKLVVVSPKTADSDRWIPIPKFLTEELQKWRCNDKCYVLNGKETPMEPRIIQYHFHRCLEKCNLNQFNFHSIRHGFATMCIEKGFDMKSLSEILGHSTVSTTMNIYVHSSMQQKKLQMDRLGV